MTQVPYSDLISYYVNRPDRRAVDLRAAGIPEGIVLGRSLYRNAYPPLPLHRHFGVAELAYVEAGHQPYDIGGQRFTLLGGEGAVIPPDTPHSSDGHPSYPGKRFWLQLLLPARPKTSWLGLSPDEAAPLLGMLRSPATPYSRWPADFPLRAAALFNLFDRPPSPTRTAMLRTGLLAVLFDLLDLNVPGAAPAYQTRVRKAIGWAETRPAKAPTLEELADVSGLSVSSFKRVFKEVAGIHRAQSLLRKGDRTVTEIAFECGFPSSQYFATVFKRVTGQTPNDVLRHRVASLPRDEDGQ